MSERSARPDPAALARRWSQTLARTHGIDLPHSEVERMAREIAEEVRTDVDASRAAAAERFARLYARAPVGIALTDTDGTIVEANEALTTVLDTAPETLQGTNLAEWAATGNDATLLQESIHRAQTEPADHVQLHMDFRHTSDERHRSKIVVTTLPADTPGQEYPVVMVQDLNEQHMLGETLRHQNVHDSLTGLPNASSFDNQLEAAVADRTHPQIALVFLDLDGFRVINDGLGAEVGDALLCAVARKLRAAFATQNGYVARLTGDGFGVLLRGELTAPAVIKHVERALDELSEPVYIGDDPVGVNASAGIVVHDTGDGQASDLKRKAEITLHRAKERGRSQWVLSEPDADAKDRSRYRMGASIAGALENGEFELTYQPTIKLDGSGELPVVNGVMHWQHPDSGPLYSADFLPLADATGMTLPLGRWMLAEAMSTHAWWHATIDRPIPDLCLRLPNRLAIDEDLVALVKKELERTNVQAESLLLCVGASTALDPRGQAPDSLSILRDLGVGLVLEVSAATDLELIQQYELPIGYIVLSGCLIGGLDRPEGAPASAVRHLEHLIASATELGLCTGADGVRTAEQADRLAELGVVAARGEFFLDSLPAEDLQPIIARRASQPNTMDQP